jgi:serine phosphatase RsbU (regulator of sigma subunit)
MSQTTKDHEGYSFFLLVKYLSLIQNNLIKEAETMMKTEIDLKPQKVQKKQVQSKEFESDIFPSTSILELRKDQLIYFREKEGKNKQGNNEKEKLEEIILKNSTCRFEYG